MKRDNASNAISQKLNLYNVFAATLNTTWKENIKIANLYKSTGILELKVVHQI